MKELEQQLTLYGITAAAGGNKRFSTNDNSDPLDNFSGATTLGLDLLGAYIFYITTLLKIVLDYLYLYPIIKCRIKNNHF